MLLSQLFETIFGFLDVNTDYSKKNVVSLHREFTHVLQSLDCFDL